MNYTTDEQLNILLCSAQAMTTARYDRLLSMYGSATQVFQNATPGNADIAVLGDDLLRQIIALKSRKKLAELLDSFERLRITVVCRNSDLYPAALMQVDEPPLLLYVKGDPTLLSAGGVSIIGARRCTKYGKNTARTFARALAQSGIPVLSGGARGVDSIANQGALDEGGKTMAILGCGIDQVYPSENRELFDHIAATGAIVTEFPPGTPPLAHHFPMRNRIIAALCDCLLVVEAGERSGCFITVHYAEQLGKEVFCVPGNIDSENSIGTNRLIADGARMANSTDDVLSYFGKKIACIPKKQVTLSVEELEIVNLLKEEDLSLDELAQKCNNLPHKIAALLTMMELRGIVYTVQGGIIALNTENEYQ